MPLQIYLVNEQYINSYITNGFRKFYNEFTVVRTPGHIQHGDYVSEIQR